MSDMDESKPHLRSLIDGEIHELEGEMIVGRLAKCNIVIDQELGASREHARFNVVDKDVFVTDLGSLNGTLVNGKEIENEAQLENGDILIFDINKYEVFIPSATAEPEIDSSSDEPEVDPNKTIFINRDEMRKREQSRQSVELADDQHINIEVAATKYDAAADRMAPEVPPPHVSKSVEPEPAPESAPEPAPEPKPDPTPPAPDASAEAVHRPGSWMVSADVNNSDRTVLAPGVVAMNAKTAQVDLTSISEPTIIVQTGENADTLWPLIGEQTEWSIGSSEDRNLRITHSGVSGNHAAIVREGSKWKVIDQMSINGTFVNGNRVNIRFINNDDLLRFGPVECRFVVPVGFVGSRKSNKGSRSGSWLLKIALPIAMLLIAGGGYYAYSTGMFSPVATQPTTATQ